MLALVGLTVLLIVVNSIRMAVMSRAQEIEIMRLVGASDQFVRWPFIVEGLLVGLLGALVTLTLLLLASGPISEVAKVIAGQVPVGFSQSLTFQVTSLVLLAGLGLGGVGAWISVRTYLREHHLTHAQPPDHDPPEPAAGWTPPPRDRLVRPGGMPALPPVTVGAPPAPASRTPLIAALFLVAVLAGSALFASGFTLGHPAIAGTRHGRRRAGAVRPVLGGVPQDHAPSTSAATTPSSSWRAPSRACSARWTTPTPRT